MVVKDIVDIERGRHVISNFLAEVEVEDDIGKYILSDETVVTQRLSQIPELWISAQALVAPRTFEPVRLPVQTGDVADEFIVVTVVRPVLVPD